MIVGQRQTNHRAIIRKSSGMIGDNQSSTIVGDIFDAFFGTGRSRGEPQRGNDLRHNIALTLEEVYTGIEKEIVIDRQELC